MGGYIAPVDGRRDYHNMAGFEKVNCIKFELYMTY